jgi:enhanced filamentous growth protein 1
MSGSVPSHMSQAPAPVPPQPNSGGRPSLDRAHTFPTPPASASSLIGIPNQGNTYDWNNQNMNSTVQTSQALPIDTGLNNTRSMPTTPATTPPGNNLQGMPPYQSQPAYDSSKSYYSSAPSTQGQYASQPLAPQSISYGQPLMKDMGPAGARPPLGPVEPDHADVKVDRYNQPNGQLASANVAPEEEPAPEQESEYVADNGAGSYANRNSYTYTANPSVASLAGDHSQMGGSPSHQNGAERMTPRTAGANPPPQWAQGYNTPPRAVPAGSISNIVSDTRGAPAAPNGDTYAPSTAYASNYSGYSSVNASIGTKRMRDDDDDRLSRSDGREADYETKRRKTLTETPVGAPVGGTFMQMQQPVPAGGVMRRR